MMDPSVASLEQPGGVPLVSAVLWLEGVLLGPVATAVAVIAVAGLGAMMLGGRIEIGRGARVILGCFILFGAAAIAESLARLASGELLFAAASPTPSVVTIPDEPAPARTVVAGASDPYAGASLPTRR
jgi:type IV secretory pathway VirB2 component (pilin)